MPPETTYEVIARILRDTTTDISRWAGGEEEYARGFQDGLNASAARLKAAMAGLPKPGQQNFHGGRGGGPDDGPGTPPLQPPPDDSGSKVIDADYAIITDPFSGQKVTVRNLPP
jgi:hypothetical protein